MVQDELWYFEVPLRSHHNELDVQSFCHQCGELILQEITEKVCSNCKSVDWSASPSQEYRKVLAKMRDPTFKIRIKREYKMMWNKKFPKYRIPEPDTVGRMIPK